MLEGIKIKLLKRHFDERGSFEELIRKDWEEILGEDAFVQANLSITHQGIIRAWHRHRKGQTDYFVCLRGTIEICVYDDNTRELDRIISTGDEPKIVRVPGHYWHGFKVIGAKPAWLIYFVDRLYDRANPDEERRAWNDQTVIPSSINGEKGDPRVGRPWDWNFPPHR